MTSTRAALLATMVMVCGGRADAKASAAESALAAPVARPEVSKGLSALACDGAGSTLPLKAWQGGVYDAQIEGRRVATRAGLAPSLDALERTARSLARVKRYHGYAAGLCPDNTGWAVALPAAQPVVLDASKLRLPVRAMEERCESWRADFAPAASGRPRALKPQGDAVSLAGLGDGTIGVTCQPRRPKWQGPVLWFLVPIGNGPGDAPPAVEALGEDGGGDERTALKERLMAWVNRVRARHDLKAVVFKKELDDEASILSIDSSLAHNRQLLKRVSDSLSAKDVSLLGENRVKGDDARAMAWLLWSSPRHRDLILHRDATVAGIAQRDIRGERMTVLVFATEAPKPMVKATPTPGKRPKTKLR